MSLFESHAVARNFQSNLMKTPDPSPKIRKRGLEQLAGKEKVLDYINRQADKVANHFDAMNAKEAADREKDFRDKQNQARYIAAGRWKNFETRIKDSEIRQKNSKRDLDLLLQLTPKAIQWGKQLDAKRKLNIDNYAAELYRDYGLGWKQAQALIENDGSAFENDTRLQGFLREIELDGNTPMDVIERIRKGGGYLPIAIQKNSATRFGQHLAQKIAQRSNEIITDLPGYDGPGISLNTAKGPLFSTVLNRLVSEELKDPATGGQRFSNKVMQLSGLNGPDGLIARTIGSFERKHAELEIQDAWNSRHKETITKIQAFIGPGPNGGEAIGASGIQKAIIHFAGGENASRENLSHARSRVVDAVIQGLKTSQLSWEEVEGLGDIEIIPRGNNGQPVKWKNYFEKEWLSIQNAGAEYERVADRNMVLSIAKENRLGREAYENTLKMIREGNPTLETLLKLGEEFKAKGPSHEKAAQAIARRITYAQNTAATRASEAFMLEQSRNNVIITDEMIESQLLNESAEANLRSLAKKHNNYLPTPGKEGTGADLKYRIKGELLKIINTGSGWQNNPGHRDAAAMAFKSASGHYRTAREQNMSHQKSYEYARDMITKEIRDEDGDYRAIDNEDGTQSHFGVKANLDRSSIWTEDQYSIMQEELTNSNGMYTKLYISTPDLEYVSAAANKGKRPAIPKQAMLASSLTRGAISPIDFLKAQVQLARDKEIQAKGSSNIQPLPDSYIKLFEKEVERIPQGLRRYLGDINPVGPNKAYTSSGYQPPNQEHYYKRVRPLVQIGDPNAIGDDDGTVLNSSNHLGYDVTNATLREVIMLMENGKFRTAGEGLWNAETLQEDAAAAGLPLETLFDPKTQQSLIDIRLKTKGVAGFPHIELEEDDSSLVEEVKTNLNEEKISSNYWRSKAACNAKACAVLTEMGYSYA